MKLFKCQVCAQLLYFENMRCERCGHILGFDCEQNTLLALEPIDDVWRAAATPDGEDSGQRFRFCSNATHAVCNWLVDDGSTEVFCTACRHNGIIPDLSQPQNVANWQKIETAKHRLVYTLLRLGLPLRTRNETQDGLIFNFLADTSQDPNARVMTGHDNGLVTLALAEADDVERERRRSLMGEPYRTLLGHFRHEVGHYYWDRLVRDGGREEECAAVFGDHSRNYEEALQVHYSQGAPPDWQDSYVSAYAAAHPWEDFAETWSHYLHIVDTLEMARAFNLQVEPHIDDTGALGARIDFNPYRVAGVGEIIDNWLPMSFALNNINRCMGQPDLYPFILSEAAIGKLAFIHDLIRGSLAPAEPQRVPEAEHV